MLWNLKVSYSYIWKFSKISVIWIHSNKYIRKSYSNIAFLLPELFIIKITIYQNVIKILLLYFSIHFIMKLTANALCNYSIKIQQYKNEEGN